MLLDEIGAGTDPLEGGALGVAIVDHFRTRGAIVIGDDPLRRAEDVRGDDARRGVRGVRRSTPTLRADLSPDLRIAGRSLALEIAARLGLTPSIIAARAAAPERARGAAGEHLARVDDDLRRARARQAALAREREALEVAEAERARRSSRCKNARSSSGARLNDRIDDRVREARREIDAVVAGSEDGGPPRWRTA